MSARWWNGAGAALIVAAVFAALALGGTGRKGLTYDELGHVTAGAGIWLFDDYRLQPENGLLCERLAGLPALLSEAPFPSRDQRAWRESDVWELGRQFCFGAGHAPDTLLFPARALVVLLGAGLVLLVYACSRALFGPAGGLLSAVACALSPAVRAHGALATSDLAVSAGLLLGTVLCVRMLRCVTPGRVLAGGLAAGALLLCKASALLLLPVVGVLCLLRVLQRGGLPVRLFGWRGTLDSRPERAVLLLGVGLAQLLLAAVVVWAGYGFRYAALAPHDAAPQAGPSHVAAPEDHSAPEVETLYYGGWRHIEAAATGGPGAEVAGPALSTALFLRDHRLLPEAWLYGFAFVLVHSTARASYLDGEVRYGGFPDFFPRAAAYKLPLGFLALLLLAGFATVRWRGTLPAEALAALAAPVLLVVVVWCAALGTRLNIGYRHLLPAEAPLCVLAGGAVLLARHAPGAGRAAVLLSVLGLGLESLHGWPDDLAFFNVLAGGSHAGWRHLVDSSLDWGQDLPGLQRWLAAHVDGRAPRPPSFLSYFGNDSPVARGIQATLLPCVPDSGRGGPLYPLTAGVYCISATMLCGVYLPVPAPWSSQDERDWIAVRADVAALDAQRTDLAHYEAFLAQRGTAFWERRVRDFELLRFARLCAVLRQRDPDAVVGGSILVYELSDAQVQAALLGPPPELRQDPAPPGAPQER